MLQRPGADAAATPVIHEDPLHKSASSRHRARVVVRPGAGDRLHPTRRRGPSAAARPAGRTLPLAGQTGCERRGRGRRLCRVSTIRALSLPSICERVRTVAPDACVGRAGEPYRRVGELLLVTFAEVPLHKAAVRQHRLPRCVRSVHPDGARNDTAGRFPKGRMAEAFAATFGAPVHTGPSASARSYVNGIDAKRSGAAEGVGEGRRPAPVQIDDSGRRGPFSGL